MIRLALPDTVAVLGNICERAIMPIMPPKQQKNHQQNRLAECSSVLIKMSHLLKNLVTSCLKKKEDFLLRQDKEHSHKPFCLIWFVSKLSIDNDIQNPHAYFCNDNLILVLHTLIAQQPKMIFNIFIREPHKWKGIYRQLNPAVDQDTLDIQHCCPSEPAGPGSWAEASTPCWASITQRHSFEALLCSTHHLCACCTMQ